SRRHLFGIESVECRIETAACLKDLPHRRARFDVELHRIAELAADARRGGVEIGVGAYRCREPRQRGTRETSLERVLQAEAETLLERDLPSRQARLTDLRSVRDRHGRAVSRPIDLNVDALIRRTEWRAEQSVRALIQTAVSPPPEALLRARRS